MQPVRGILLHSAARTSPTVAAMAYIPRLLFGDNGIHSEVLHLCRPVLFLLQHQESSYVHEQAAAAAAHTGGCTHLPTGPCADQ